MVLVQSKTVENSITWYLERKYALTTFSIVQPHSELPACTCIFYWLLYLPLCLLESWFPLVTEYQQAYPYQLTARCRSYQNLVIISVNFFRDVSSTHIDSAFQDFPTYGLWTFWLTVAVFGGLRSKFDVTSAPLVLIIPGGDSFLGNIFKLSTNSRLSNTSTFPYSHHIFINTRVGTLIVATIYL